MKAFLRKQFLSKPVDRFDGLTNNYTRFIYKWQCKAPDLRYDKNPQYLQDCRLLGEDIMTPYSTLDMNAKIVRLEEPTEIVDISDAIDAFMKLIGNEQGYIGTIVDKMINEFGLVKTCRLLGHLIAAGNVFNDEWEYGGETHGGWRYVTR